MHGPEVIVLAVGIVGMLFIGLPWLIFHYVTKWKSQATITTEDENLLDELHELARRLDERMITIERIVQADNPNWRAIAGDPVETALEDRSERIYETERASNRPSRRSR
jgi:phage shock protein B